MTTTLVADSIYPTFSDFLEQNNLGIANKFLNYKNPTLEIYIIKELKRVSYLPTDEREKYYAGINHFWFMSIYYMPPFEKTRDLLCRSIYKAIPFLVKSEYEARENNHKESWDEFELLQANL